MDYDFFEDKKEEKEAQRIPTPSVSSGNHSSVPPQTGRKIPLWVAFLSVGLAVIVFLAGYLVCWLSLDSELRSLVKVKEQIQKNYYKEVTDEQFYGAIFGGINDDLLDDYSEYMTPEEFAAYTSNLQGSRVGIGLVFGGDDLLIVRVCGNSPAEAAGILAGEKILGCGSTQTEIVSCNTFSDFSNAIAAYEENEEFWLRIESSSGEREVKISKQAYEETLVFYRTNTLSVTFSGERLEETTHDEPMRYLAEDTAYIRLVEFTGKAAEEFDRAMECFKRDGKKNLVLDLRGNGGGLLSVMQSIAGYFCKTSLESEPIVAIADYGEREEKFRALKNVYSQYFSEDSRIVLLADSGSASASECLIGCMVDYGAVSFEDVCLVERGGKAKTFGKGIMQETYIVNLLGQDALKLTTAEILWPSRRSIHGVGVLPTDGAVTIKEQSNFEEETKSAIEKFFE